MQHLIKLLAIVSLASFSFALYCPTEGRLLVSDFHTNQVHVFELDDAKTTLTPIASFSISDSKAAVYHTKSGKFGAIFQRNTGQVHFLRSGITITEEGVSKVAPSLHNYVQQGPRPTHFVSDMDKIAIFFDGVVSTYNTSGFAIIDEKSLEAVTPNVFSHDGILTHHGVALATQNDHVLVSIKNPTSAVSATLPDGFHIYDKNMQLIEDLNQQDDHHASCQGYHGSAHLPNQYAFGCAAISATDSNHGGILLVDKHANGTYSSRKVQYLDDHINTRTGTLAFHPSVPYYIGSYDTTVNGSTFHGFIRIDTKATQFTDSDVLHNIGYTRCSWELDNREGKLLVALGNDGGLRIYENPRDWSIAPKTVNVIPFAFNCSGDQLHPDARMYVSWGNVLISYYDRNAEATAVVRVDLTNSNYPVKKMQVTGGYEFSAITVVGSCYTPVEQQDTSFATRSVPAFVTIALCFMSAVTHWW